MVLDTIIARLAQPAERKALNLVVVGSSPTVGVSAVCLMQKQSKFLPGFVFLFRRCCTCELFRVCQECV